MTSDREAPSIPVDARPRRRGSESISFKVGVLFILVLILAIANIAIIQNLTKSFEGVAETVNVTGRLRMLTQKYAFDATKMFYLGGEDVALFATSEEVQNTLNALVMGDRIDGYQVVPLAENRREQVARIRSEWQLYENAIWRTFGASPSETTDVHLQMQQISQLSGRLLAHTDALVHGLTTDAELVQQKSLRKIYGLIFVNVVVLAMFWFFARASITRPLNELAYMGRLLGQGDFSKRADIHYKGEIGQLAAALNYAAGQINASIQQMKQDKEQLAHAEAMFRGLADNSMAGVYIIKHGRFEYVNQKMADMFLYQREELLASVTVNDILSEAGRPTSEGRLQRRLDEALDHGHGEMLAHRRDGSVFEVEIFGSKMQVGEQVSTIGILLDVTERNRINRGICLLSACNQAVVHAADEQTLREAVCSIVSRIGRYPFAWIGMLDETGALRTSVQAEERDGLYTSLAGTSAWDRIIAPAEHALTTNRTVVTDIGADARESLEPWLREVLPKALRVVSLPLRNGGRPVGVLTVCSEYPDAFGENEVVVLEDAAANLAYGMFALRTEALRLEYAEKLEHQAHHDTLTGLANRSLLSDRMEQAIAMAHRLNKQAAVLLLDLDKFKAVNDTYGHAAGDMLLQAVADRLSSSVRKTDTVARLGGDEFIVLLTNIKRQDEVSTIAQKILDNFAAPFQLVDINVYASTSLGIAIYPQDGDNEQLLMKRADIAMYRAKEHGTNQFDFYTEASEGRSERHAV